MLFEDFMHFQKPQPKKPTKAEQIRRRFTPSPENSAGNINSDEELEKRMERHEHDRKHSSRRQRQEKR